MTKFDTDLSLSERGGEADRVRGILVAAEEDLVRKHYTESVKEEHIYKCDNCGADSDPMTGAEYVEHLIQVHPDRLQLFGQRMGSRARLTCTICGRSGLCGERGLLDHTAAKHPAGF